MKIIFVRNNFLQSSLPHFIRARKASRSLWAEKIIASLILLFFFQVNYALQNC